MSTNYLIPVDMPFPPALNTDLRWLKEHTRLGVLSRRWDERKRLNGLLLRGSDLVEAEHSVASHPREAPEPTALHLGPSNTWTSANRHCGRARWRPRRHRGWGSIRSPPARWGTVLCTAQPSVSAGAFATRSASSSGVNAALRGHCAYHGVAGKHPLAAQSVSGHGALRVL